MSNTKYSAVFFNNGRVVLYEDKILDKAIKQNKDILFICNAWSGGYACAMGADKRFDFDFDTEVYDMYGYDIKDTILTPEEVDKFYRVIISSGEMIYMNSGRQANTYQSGNFCDWDTKDRDIIKFNSEKFINIAPKDRDETIKRLRTTVNEALTINYLNRNYINGKVDKEDLKDRVQCLINYGVLSNNALNLI